MVVRGKIREWGCVCCWLKCVHAPPFFYRKIYITFCLFVLLCVCVFPTQMCSVLCSEPKRSSTWIKLSFSIHFSDILTALLGWWQRQKKVLCQFIYHELWFTGRKHEKYKSIFLKAIKSEILVKNMMKEMSVYSTFIGECI